MTRRAASRVWTIDDVTRSRLAPEGSGEWRVGVRSGEPLRNPSLPTPHSPLLPLHSSLFTLHSSLFSPHMLLPPNRVGLAQPVLEHGIDVVGMLEPKHMDMVARRDCLNTSKAGVLHASRQHHMAIQPPSSRRHLRERHPHLKRDACFLGEDRHGAQGAYCGGDTLEQGTNRLRLPHEVMRQIVPTARVRLVSVRKGALATRTTPQWRQMFGGRHARNCPCSLPLPSPVPDRPT